MLPQRSPAPLRREIREAPSTPNSEPRPSPDGRPRLPADGSSAARLRGFPQRYPTRSIPMYARRPGGSRTCVRRRGVAPSIRRTQRGTRGANSRSKGRIRLSSPASAPGASEGATSNFRQEAGPGTPFRCLSTELVSTRSQNEMKPKKSRRNAQPCDAARPPDALPCGQRVATAKPSRAI